MGQDSEEKKRQVSELGKKARDLYDQAMTAKEERRKQFLELAKSQEAKQERERFLREFVISPEISHALAGTIEASGSHLRSQYNIQPPDFERFVQDISTQIQTRIPQVDLSDETIDKLAQSQLKTLNSFEQQREKKENTLSAIARRNVGGLIMGVVIAFVSVLVAWAMGLIGIK